MKKSEKVREHLLRGMSLTTLESTRIYGLQRLASLVNRMRNEGHDIRTIMMDGDEGTKYAKYVMKPYFRK